MRFVWHTFIQHFVCMECQLDSQWTMNKVEAIQPMTTGEINTKANNETSGKKQKKSRQKSKKVKHKPHFISLGPMHSHM